MIDYRVERWSGCKAYHIAGMRMDEIDPACPMLKFIADKMKLSIEQKFWLAWLYSTCYSAPTAFFMITQLPSPEISKSEIENWWLKNKSRMVFESDRRYVKNFDEFPKMFESYRNFTRRGQLKTFLKFKGENKQTLTKKFIQPLKKNFIFLEDIVFLCTLKQFIT